MKIYIGTTGPFSLICALSLLMENIKNEDEIYVFHYVYHPAVLVDTLKWICRRYNLEYIGNCTDIQENLLESMGKNILQKAINAIKFKPLSRRWAESNFPGYSDKTNRLVLSFRPNIREILLSNLFQHTPVQFVCDGALVGESSEINLSMRMKLKLLRLKNPFSQKKSRVDIACLEGLENVLTRFGSPKPIPQNNFEDITKHLFNSQDFRNWKQILFPKGPPQESTCLLLQNLYQWKWIDAFEEISFYARIIEYELANSDRTIIVKAHPRDNAAKLMLLKLLIPDTEKKRVVFLSIDKFSSLPVELMFREFNIISLVGLFSTSLLTGKKLFDMDVTIFSDYSLPMQIQNRIRNFVEDTGLPMVYL